MKQQPEATIQFSGYPLSIVETEKKIKKPELIVIRPSTNQSSSQKNPITNDPENWDLEWFTNYE